MKASKSIFFMGNLVNLMIYILPYLIKVIHNSIMSITTHLCCCRRFLFIQLQLNYINLFNHV